jgi:hypothetical protein
MLAGFLAGGMAATKMGSMLLAPMCARRGKTPQRSEEACFFSFLHFKK